MLTNLSDKQPSLISDILNELKNNFDEIGSVRILKIWFMHLILVKYVEFDLFCHIKNSMYLFKTLPLQNWSITMDNLSYIEQLILNHPITSTENTLSRYVLTKLYSGCNENNFKYGTCLLNFIC